MPAPPPARGHARIPRNPANSRTSAGTGGCAGMTNLETHHKHKWYGSLNAHQSTHSNHVSIFTYIKFYSKENRKTMLEKSVNKHAPLEYRN